MEQMVSSSVGSSRFRTVLLMLFSMLALVMASIGVYGVTSYTTAQRTKEFGVYVALGATNGDVLRLVLGRSAELIATGLALGVLTSFVLTRFIAQLLFGVAALDPMTFVIVPLFLFAVALLASYVPARRAMNVDPIVALRHE